MYQHIKVPAEGQKITVNADYSLNVPDNPIIDLQDGNGQRERQNVYRKRRRHDVRPQPNPMQRVGSVLCVHSPAGSPPAQECREQINATRLTER